MLFIPYLALYLLAGILIVRWLLPLQRPQYRLWLGLSLGLMLLMWLPALMAFLLSFSVTGHLLALLPLALVTLGAWLGRSKATPRALDAQDRRDLKLLLYVALPLSLLGLFLQWTHNLRPLAGALTVGQSTYGDLALHTGIITSLRNARFPAEYSILPGVRLSYPFLVDSLSTSAMLLGMSLQAALVLPGTLMMALVFTGFTLLALRLSGRRRVAALAVLLLFINGGLGFLYSLDMAGVSLGSAGQDGLKAGAWLERLSTILRGWYQTPANHAEFTRYNLRWSNIIADMLVPQRSFLAGWCFLFPCLYLLVDGLEDQWQDRRGLLLLGLMAGGLPLIHTHSFLALGLCSLGMMVYSLLKKKPLLPWLCYGGIAVLLAAPQLLFFTFRQAGGEHFLRFQFNWVNNLGGRGLQDGYFWFYLKNIGLPFLILLLSLFEKNSRHRLLFAGAFTIFVISEFILFQPNEYDNNKLFYVWYALCLVPVSDYLWGLWDRLKGLRARPLIGGLTALLLFASGTLAILRECIGRYDAFGPAAVRLAAFTEKETPEHSRFMAGWDQHLNPVSALSGRTVLCGPDLWLYYHGFDTSERKRDIAAFYADPANNLGILQKHALDYILLGPSEQNAFHAEEEALNRLFPRVYHDEEGGYSVYQVPPG